MTVVAILARCIGANTAILAVVDGAMVRPRPFPEPGRLTSVVAAYRFEGKEAAANNFSGATWEAIRDYAPSLDSAYFRSVGAGSTWASGATRASYRRRSADTLRSD